MSIELSSRLATVASFLPAEAVLADIGSDHAYLPVYALQRGLISRAIAGEVVQGPFESAVKTVRQNGLASAVEVRLGDGLAVVSPEDGVTAVTICGMGGELIAQILDRGVSSGHLKGDEVLVLQPNVAEHLVREWLVSNGYAISQETIVEDHHRLYEIIVAHPATTGTRPLSELELLYGPHLLAQPNSLTIQKWTRQLHKLGQIIDQLQQSQQPQEEKLSLFTKKYNDLKGVIDHANR